MFTQNGLKGQQAHSPGQRPGYRGRATVALKGQKPWTEASPPTNSFALSGRGCAPMPTQGDALGYVLIGLSGRLFDSDQRSSAGRGRAHKNPTKL